MPSRLHLFPQLPAELQLQIWEAVVASIPPQRITLITQACKKTLRATAPDKIFLKALYWTCPDARQKLWTRYKICFKTQLVEPILFDPETDYVYFPTGPCLKNFFEATSAASASWDDLPIKHVAMYLPVAVWPPAASARSTDDRWFFDLQISELVLAPFLTGLKSLTDIMFVNQTGGEISELDAQLMVSNLKTTIWYHDENRGGLRIYRAKIDGPLVLPGIRFGITELSELGDRVVRIREEHED